MTMTTMTTTATECPTCGKKGKAINPVTLRALLNDEFVGQVADAEYRFCDAKGCDVVYYGNGQTFTKSQLKVAVGVKETSGERPLCYCFGHSVATITEELRTKGQSDALEDIRRKMKDPGCSCEVKNPSGSCCLGTVAKGIETAKAELNPTKSSGNRAETISKVGTVLSAIMASSCCWLPLLLLAFGVSGAGIAGVLDSYRPLFIVLTVGFLAAAFYFTYRPRKSQASEGDCCSTAHDCCAVPQEGTKRRFSMMTVNKVMLWAVTLLAVAFLFFPNYMGFFLTGGSGGEPTTNNPLVRTTSFTVEGMTCEGCSALVEKVIKDVPGVLSVKVDYDKKRAVVGSEACCSPPTDAIIDALQRAGYRAAVIEPDNAATKSTDNEMKVGCCEKDCCKEPAANDKANTVTHAIDPDRQIVFTVQGLACPAVKGIGCGHRLAPVLERLNKLEGVEASSANHTGTMLRVSVKTAAEREKVAAVVEKDLAADKRQPNRLTADELRKALKAETWRGQERVRELSAIEFRKLALDRVEAFSKSEKLADDVSAKLLSVAEKEWDRLAKAADTTEANQSPRKTDWRKRGSEFSKAFCEQAKELLTADQLNRLSQMLANCVERLPVAEKK
jgi:copper chaperone CopZ